MAELVGHDDMVRALTFSADGRQLMSGSEDGSLRFWDVDEAAALGGPIALGSGIVWASGTATDGRVHVAAGDQVYAVTIGSAAWRDAACRLAARELTPDEHARYLGGDPEAVCRS